MMSIRKVKRVLLTSPCLSHSMVTVSTQASRIPSMLHRSYHRQYRQPPPPRSRFLPKFLISLGVLSAASFVAWWVYWPHHTFTSSVAKILRKALWAESAKDGPDFQSALKFYLEALKQADVEGMNTFSDEYTGIQLKIAEMYERLNMNQDALMVYSEIAAMYLDQLTSGQTSDPKIRGHLIQKDLRVVIKMVELNQSNAEASKMLLMTHFIIAQEEVSRRSREAKQLIDQENIELIAGHEQQPQELTESMALSEKALVKNPAAWAPFRDELFNARDLYVAICVSKGELSNALRAKISTTSWMLNADCNPGEILMSQTNLGSIMYLQAEEFEAQELSLTKAKKNEREVEEAKISKERCIKLSTDCYESVLSFTKKLPANLRRDENVEESIALATYGLGVIKLHLGELDLAKSLLREARLRAKGSGFADLVVEAERELASLQKEVDERGDKGVDETDRIKRLLKRQEDQPDIELDIQFVKHK